MERKSVSFEQLSDIFGFRVIVETVDDCYRALGVVHTTWPMVPGRYKDYISTPKQNDYRSIHTTRDRPGHASASSCRSAPRPWRRSPSTASLRMPSTRRASTTIPSLAKESRAYQWLRRTIDLLAEGDNPEEFLEHTKLELFHDQVFCFTPEGPPHRPAPRRDADRLRLCGAHRRRQHRRRLQDQRPHGAAPDRTAERRRGRDRPRRRTDAAGRVGIPCRHRQGARLDPARHTRGGAPAIYRARPPDPGARLRASRASRSRTKSSRRALPRLARASIEDVLAAVGRGEMFSGDVVRAVYPDHKDDRRTASPEADRGERTGDRSGRRTRRRTAPDGDRPLPASRSADRTPTCPSALPPRAERSPATGSSAS